MKKEDRTVTLVVKWFIPAVICGLLSAFMLGLVIGSFINGGSK